MHPRRITLVAVIAVVLSACAVLDAVEPNLATDGQKYSEIVQGQVRVTLTVTPSVLHPPGTVVATLSYENVGKETVALGSAYGCLSFAHVYLGNERIPFPATQYACTAALSSRDLDPGIPLTVQWPLVIGGKDGVRARAGTYRFVAELNTHAENLERTFIVR